MRIQKKACEMEEGVEMYLSITDPMPDGPDDGGFGGRGDGGGGGGAREIVISCSKLTCIRTAQATETIYPGDITR